MKTITKNDIKTVQNLFKQFMNENYYHNATNQNNKEIENVYVYNVYYDYKDQESIEYQINKLDEITTESIEELKYEIIDSFYGYGQDNDVLNEISKEFYNSYYKTLSKYDLTDFVYDNEFLEHIEIEFNFSQLENMIYDSTINSLVYLENEESFNQEFDCNNFNQLIDTYDLNDPDEKTEFLEVIKDSGILKLAHKLGYTTDQVINYLLSDVKTDDKQLHSIYEEIINSSNYCGLVALKKLSVTDYLKILEDKKVTINKNDEIGLFNAFNGSGAMLEIELNKEVTYKENEFKLMKDGQLGYTIEEVYGRYF